MAPAVSAHDARVPHTLDQHQVERLTERVFVIHGPQELPSRRTGGFMSNPGFVLSDDGVIIIDPGSSVGIGRELLTKIREISDRPVIAVFNTHVHGDHWLGNHAVREAYPDVAIYAHQRMIERVRAGEGEDWVRLLDGMTEGAIAGTDIVAPGVGLQGGELLDLDGVSLRIHHTGKAHTDHDIMIEIVDDRSLFLGDVVTARRVPSSDVPGDASFSGQIQAIRSMMGLPVKLFIPGHGHSGGLEVPAASLDFLETLYTEVKRHYELGLSDFEMKNDLAEKLAEYRDWHNFDQLGRVISHVYLEVEAASF